MLTKRKTMVYEFNPTNKSLNERVKKAWEEHRLIQTPRLTLFPVSTDDAPYAFTWVSDAEVAKYMRYTPYAKVEDEAEWLAQLASDESGVELGVFLSDGTLIGSVGLFSTAPNEYELGYHFNRAYWGKGYATETCKAVLDWATVILSAQCFSANYAKQNARSEAVANKCGFVFDRFGEITKIDGSETFISKHSVLNAPKVCNMNLYKQPFAAICAGHKTIELRLYDEKRRTLNIGDLIAFNCNGKIAVAHVTALNIFSSFDELYANVDLSKCGYLPLEVPFASPKDMNAYYSRAARKKWGAVAIGIDFNGVLYAE